MAESRLNLPYNFSWLIENEICGCAKPVTDTQISALASVNVGLLVSCIEVAAHATVTD
jgi:hypothetical protein